MNNTEKFEKWFILGILAGTMMALFAVTSANFPESTAVVFLLALMSFPIGIITCPGLAYEYGQGFVNQGNFPIAGLLAGFTLSAGTLSGIKIILMIISVK